MTLRPLRALREINATLSELELADRRAEEEARIELARSASRYSQRAKEVVDGTMSLSAVLMRAGEVEEAERLLADVARDVSEEKQVLQKTVREVASAKASRRDSMSRLRLAKLVATALLGGSVFAFSAVGVAVAKYFSDGVQASPSTATAVAAEELGRREVAPSGRGAMVVLPLGDLKIELSQAEYEEYRRLVSAEDADRLRSFLMSILPPGLAKKVDGVLSGAGLTAANDLIADVDTSKPAQQVRKTVSGSSAPSSSGSGSGAGSDKPSQGSSKSSSDDEPTSGEEGTNGTSGCEGEPEEGGNHGAAMGPIKKLREQCVPVFGDASEEEGS